MEESQGKESVGIHSSHQGRDSFRARVPAPERMQAASRSERFHPYRRQFSDAAAASLGASPRPLPPSYSGFHGGETREVTHGAAKVSWNQYDDGFLDSKLTGSQCAYPELPAPPVEPPCCLSQSPAHFRPLGPVSQFSSKMHSMKGTPSGSQYTVVSSLKEVTSQSLFPKPIYSYSILIFMALKNSQTGSLPVSEIYSFMMEQFPYFKTAPDGWKNSVRHNLSLNKCFEKVENKMGNSSRKGCLWALNPAKVDKMQEELNKWRRKDSVSVRKSMVRPEDLERLLGEKPEKIPPSPAFPNQASLPKRSSAYDSITLSLPNSRLQDSGLASRHPHYPHVSTPSQQRPGYLSPTAPHPPNLFPLYSPCGQQPPSGLPSHMRGMDSPIAGKTPPAYCASLCPEYGFSPGSMQEVILKGDASYDVDSINPSLTDLQLQGNLWEELREDSMAPDSLSHITTFPLSITQIQIQTQGRPDLASVIGLGKGEEEVEEVEDMMGCGFSSEQHINGRYPMVYSGVESLAGYLTSCTTSVSLL